jgi:hypothetical protein
MHMSVTTPSRSTAPHRAALRAAFLLVAAAGALGACRHGKLALSEDPPAHREPTTTSVYGDWVLATPTDSTGFAGAKAVELKLDRTSFVVTAIYPNSAPQTIRGTVGTGENGLLTLTPGTSSQSTIRSAGLVMVAGQPITVLASAAGNTMVFSTPRGSAPQDPSSIWHRKDAAKAAGDQQPKPILP